MRIVYVITRADEIGGGQVHVRDLSTALHAAGHEVTVLAGAPGRLSDQLADHGVRFEAVPSMVRPIALRHDAMAVHQLSSMLRRLRPELVSLHSSKAGWLGRIAARRCRLPVVFTAHGWPFTGGAPASARRVYPTLERLTATWADRIITVSDHDRAVALEKRIAPPQKIVRIYNGVIDATGPRRPLPPPGPPRIFMSGRFSAQKDHAGLFHALARLRELEWSLALAGEGASQDQARRLASTLGIADRVEFLGMRDDVLELLAGAHIYALISHWEGLPYGILEAMSAGLPVVASQVGGVPEAVLDETTGFLVPRAAPEATARRLAQLIKDADLRHALGTAGRRHYENEFRFETMYERTLAEYRLVIAARGTDAALARGVGG